MSSWNNKVIWTEGMFLRPQHFQQQDRHLQNWVESRCSDLRPYGWGLSKIEIDEQLLSLGKYAITSCHGVFPDGTPFRIPEDYPPPTPLEISTNTKEEIIYLALPARRETGKDVSDATGEDNLSRYRRQEFKPKDLHSDLNNNAAVIETGELWTRLRLASQDQGAFTTIPIARIIERRADNSVVLDERFISSCIHCISSTRLTDYIQEIQGLLHHRGETLATRLGSPGAGGAAEVADFLLLQIVNRYEPLFNHFAELRALHPESLYRIAVQMAGELATITKTDRRPVAYPPYIHSNLTSTFEPIVEAIREALNWVPEFRAIPLPLEEHKYGIRTATIHDSEVIKSANFVLAVNAQIPTDQLRSNFPRQTTIATAEKLRDLVMSHTPGVKIRVMSVAPRQIPYHAGFTYFELDKHHNLWKELEKTGVIAMHFSGEYPGLELEFWAIRA